MVLTSRINLSHTLSFLLSLCLSGSARSDISADVGVLRDTTSTSVQPVLQSVSTKDTGIQICLDSTSHLLRVESAW